MVGEIVLIGKFLGDVGKTDRDVLGAVEGRAQVEVADVKGVEFCATSRQETVDHHLD